MTQNENWMREAIAEAQAALAGDEVPIGAVVVHEPSGRIIGRGHNRRETDADPTAHAEILALRQAARELKSWRLIDCVIVVTLEPCPMCAGAIVAHRLGRLVFGAWNTVAGAAGSLYNVVEDPRLNHHVDVRRGALAEECGAPLAELFAELRL